MTKPKLDEVLSYLAAVLLTAAAIKGTLVFIESDNWVKTAIAVIFALLLVKTVFKK